MRQARITADGTTNNWENGLRSQLPDARYQDPGVKLKIRRSGPIGPLSEVWDLGSEVCDLSGFYRFPECCDPLPTGSLQQAHHTHVTKPKEEQREKRNRSPHVQANRIKNG